MNSHYNSLKEMFKVQFYLSISPLKENRSEAFSISVLFDKSIDDLKKELGYFYEKGYAFLPRSPRKDENQSSFFIPMDKVIYIKVMPVSNKEAQKA